MRSIRVHLLVLVLGAMLPGALLKGNDAPLRASMAGVLNGGLLLMLTELHGGTIRLETRGEARGSRFVVTLPLAAVAAISAVSEPVHVDGGAAQRILVVDDNVDALEMMQSALGQFGHVLATAANGADALAVAAEFHPEVGVLDIGLPGMSGYELARRLRAAHPGIRLIALTGYGQAADIDAAAAAGFDAHCAKPVTTTALLDQIGGPTVSGADVA